jgi:hypothetical protein
MSNPKLRQKCEAQRKESEEHFTNLLLLNNAFMIILGNAQSIKDGNGSTFAPEEAIIIEEIKEKLDKFSHILKFLDIWEKNQLKVEIL